jgi:hypothetical protein
MTPAAVSLPQSTSIQGSTIFPRSNTDSEASSGYDATTLESSSSYPAVDQYVQNINGVTTWTDKMRTQKRRYVPPRHFRSNRADSNDRWSRVSSHTPSLSPTSTQGSPISNSLAVDGRYDRCEHPGCRQEFTGEPDCRKGNFQRHMKSTHGKERYPCVRCEKSYNRRDNLIAHVRRSHPEQDLPPPRKRGRGASKSP